MLMQLSGLTHPRKKSTAKTMVARALTTKTRVHLRGHQVAVADTICSQLELIELQDVGGGCFV